MSSAVEEPITAPAPEPPAPVAPPPVAVYGTEHQLTLVLYGVRKITTAVVTGWGTWHIGLGHIPVGPGHKRHSKLGPGRYRPVRRAWIRARSKHEATMRLYAIGYLLMHKSGGDQ